MRLFKYLPLLSLLIALSSTSEAGIFGGKCKPTGSCDTVACAPCHYTCCPELKTVKVKKHCWETECEPVCIPRVQCPLFNFFRKTDCDPCTEILFNGRSLNGRCADVRVVKKLKKVSYECEKCVVEWNVRCVSSRAKKSCDGISVSGSCCQMR